MNTKVKTSLYPLFIGLVIALGLLATHQISNKKFSFFNVARSTPLTEIKTLINRKFMDDISLDSLQSSSIDSLLLKLDPHSRYIPPQELQGELEDMRGMFYGIGVEYALMDDSVHILQVLPGSPALLAGLRLGDIVLRVGDSSISGRKRTTQQIKALLTGKKGSSVQLTVKRASQTLSLQAERKEVDMNSIDAAFYLQPGTG